MRKIDPFIYVNQYYGLDLHQGRRVVATFNAVHRAGYVWKGDGQYIHIKFDDTGRTEGPYHPTDNLEYPVEAK